MHKIVELMFICVSLHVFEVEQVCDLMCEENSNQGTLSL